jgi:hypothetical protein
MHSVYFGVYNGKDKMNQTIITILISSFSGGGIALLILKFISQKTIENQFARSIEKYRFKINSEFDRVSKIHEKEFSLLPSIWESIEVTSNFISAIASPFQRYPDLNSLCELELKEFLNSTDLPESVKIKIRSASDKVDEYRIMHYYDMTNNANNALSGYTKLFLINRIFFSGKMEDLLSEIRSDFLECVSVIEKANKYGKIDYEYLSKCKIIIDRFEIKKETLSGLIKERLIFRD